MKRGIHFALILLLPLFGCAGTGGGTGGLTPAQILSGAHEIFGIAQMGGAIYASFPACGSPPKMPCSNPAIVTQINAAESAASGALATADSEQAAGTLTTQSAAILAVQSAVKAYLASVSQPGVPSAPASPVARAMLGQFKTSVVR